MDKKSKLGYKKDSPYKNEKSIKINSNSITMKGVEFPLIAYPDNDPSQVMYPGMDYYFPNSTNVTEVPMKKYQDGGKMLEEYLSKLPSDMQDKFVENFVSLSPQEQEMAMMSIRVMQQGGTSAGLAEVEGGETVKTPDGQLYKFEGPKHSEGGIPTMMEEGSKVFSEHRKAPREIAEQVLGRKTTKKFSYADLSKKFPTQPFVDILEDPNADKYKKKSAEIQLAKNEANLEVIFFAQEKEKTGSVVVDKFQDGGKKDNSQYYQPESGKYYKMDGMSDRFVDEGGGNFWDPETKWVYKRNPQTGEYRALSKFDKPNPKSTSVASAFVGDLNSGKPFKDNATTRFFPEQLKGKTPAQVGFKSAGDDFYINPNDPNIRYHYDSKTKKYSIMTSLAYEDKRPSDIEYSNYTNEELEQFVDLYGGANPLAVKAYNKRMQSGFSIGDAAFRTEGPRNTPYGFPTIDDSGYKSSIWDQGIQGDRTGPGFILDFGSGPQMVPDVNPSTEVLDIVIPNRNKSKVEVPKIPQGKSTPIKVKSPLVPPKIVDGPAPLIEANPLGIVEPEPVVTPTETQEEPWVPKDIVPGDVTKKSKFGISPELAGTFADIGLALSDKLNIQGPAYYDRRKYPLFNRFYEFDDKEVQRMYQLGLQQVQNSNVPEAVKQAQKADILAKSQDYQSKVDFTNLGRYEEWRNTNLNKLQSYVDANTDIRVADIDSFRERKAKVDYLKDQFHAQRKSRVVNSIRGYADYVDKINVANQMVGTNYKSNPFTGKVEYIGDKKTNLTDTIMSEYAKNSNNKVSLPNGATGTVWAGIPIIIDKDGNVTTLKPPEEKK